jgi:hypothetical protein
MPDDLASAMRTLGRQGMDGALKTVENVHLGANAYLH